MQKKENSTPLAGYKKDLIAIALGSIGGIGLVCVGCLLFGLLILAGFLSLQHVGLWAGCTVLLGGFTSGLLIGNRGRMLLYVPLSFGLMFAILFLLGEGLFGGVFQPGADPLILSALLLGLLLGSSTANLR